LLTYLLNVIVHLGTTLLCVCCVLKNETGHWIARVRQLKVAIFVLSSRG